MELTRAPVTETVEGTLAEEVEAIVNVVMHWMPATDQRIEELEDNVCREVTEHVKEGWL